MSSTRRPSSAWRGSVVSRALPSILPLLLSLWPALWLGCAHRAVAPIDPGAAAAMEGEAPAPTRAELTAEGWRAEARRVLEEAAGSPDPAVRARALRALIAAEESGGAAGGPWARRCRWDPIPLVQQALIGSGARDLVAELSAQGADGLTRGLAALWLTGQAERGDLSAQGAGWLADARRLQAWDRPLLLLAVARAGGPDAAAAAELLRAWLRQGDYPLEPSLFAALSRYGDASMAGPLAEGIPRAEAEVRPLAAAALLALDPAQAQPILGGLIREAGAGGDLAAGQVLDLIDALAALPGGGKADPAAGWLRTAGASDPAARDLSRAALVARRALPPSKLRPMLRDAEDPWLQRDAALALAAALARDPDLRAPTLIGPLREMVAAESPSTRFAAAEALGSLGDTGVLTPLLEDGEPRIRVAAAAALLR